MKEITVRKNNRLRVQTMNFEPSLANQSFKDECDINNIMRKHGHDPVAFNTLTRKGGVYGDFSEISDYQGMLQKVADAQDAFSSLPSALRERFRNSPGELIEFLQNPQNYDEGVKLGLLVSKQNNQVPTATKNELNENEAGTHSKKSKSPATPSSPPKQLDE